MSQWSGRLFKYTHQKILAKSTRKNSYSETGCSFARHFAILSRNVGILIGSLLRASCDSNFNLLPEQTVFHIGIL